MEIWNVCTQLLLWHRHLHVETYERRRPECRSGTPARRLLQEVWHCEKARGQPKRHWADRALEDLNVPLEGDQATGTPITPTQIERSAGEWTEGLHSVPLSISKFYNSTKHATVELIKG